MDRRITVTGKGRALVKPDFIEIGMKLETKEKKYDTALERAADRVGSLAEALASAGFGEDDVKTSNFDVSTTTEYKDGLIGRGKQVETGFKVSQNVKIGFDMDMKRLAQVLEAIGQWSGSDPDLSVSFTVKDPDAVKDQVLQSAAKSARHQAEILCGASGVKLGALVTVNYAWSEISIRSRTIYHDARTVTRDRSASLNLTSFAKLQPDDIDARDSATFVWEIE